GSLGRSPSPRVAQKTFATRRKRFVDLSGPRYSAHNNAAALRRPDRGTAMRAVLMSAVLGTGVLLAPGAGAFGQTRASAPAPAASLAQSIAKIQESQMGSDVARRPYPLAGGGQQARVVMHGWGPTYVPTRPEEIPVLAAPQVLTTGVYPWSSTVDTPRTWSILSIQSPCWKC